MIRSLCIVALGGALGAVARFLSGRAVSSVVGASVFPWGTFLINVVGCLLIGLFSGWAVRGGLLPQWRLLLVVGFCGSFTTFSTFSSEGFSLLSASHIVTWALYVAMSVFLGLLAVWAGDFLSRL